MEQEIILLGLKPYDFTDNSGKRVAGASAWVIPKHSSDDGTGMLPVKYAVPLDQLTTLGQVPLPASATLNLNFDLRTNRVKFAGFSNLKPIDLVV